MATKYRYHDERGRLRYTVERQAQKKFRLVGPNGRKLPDPISDEQAVLYRLPELLSAAPARTVYVCEGEKDVETLIERGLIATTMPCGTRKGWLPKYNRPFEGRHVVILPDADGPGRRHAEAVYEHLSSVAETVVVVDLHARERGPWDVTDWMVRRDRDVEDLERQVAKARYAAVGMRDRSATKPIKQEQMWLLLHSPFSTAEKLLLIAVQEALGWAATGPLPTASSLAEWTSLHRVSVQRVLRDLRGRGLITRDREEHAAHWSLLAALCAAAGHRYSSSHAPHGHERGRPTSARNAAIKD